VFSTQFLSSTHVSDRSLCDILDLMRCPEVFSEGFLEGQMMDMALPSDAVPHTDNYGYLSDSDLEDEPPCSEDEDQPHEGDSTGGPLREDEPEPCGPQESDSQVPSTTTSGDLPLPLADIIEGKDDHRSAPSPVEVPN
jgi:hypothetical protein